MAARLGQDGNNKAIDAQYGVLRRILKLQKGSSLFAQLGLQRLESFTDFENMYQGFCRAVAVQSAPAFLHGIAKMLPQGDLPPLEVLQSPNLLVRGKPSCACPWRGNLVPVVADVVASQLAVAKQLRENLRQQKILADGDVFYLFEQEMNRDDARRAEGVEQLAVPLKGWHGALEQQRDTDGVLGSFMGLLGKKTVGTWPHHEGLPLGGSRWQWFNAMHDQLKTAGPKVEMLVTAPKTLIDFCLYVSQQEGRFMLLRELLPNLKAMFLNHYDVALQRVEMGFLLGGLGHVRWLQWLYGPLGVQAWQADANIRQRLDLLTAGEVFYEFIPLENVDPVGRLQRGYHRLHVGQVQVGREYVLVVSNTAGMLGINTEQIVKILGVEPFQVAFRGPVVQLHGLGEGIREDMLVETLGNINSALVAHGVFVREALLGHVVSDRQPFWVLEVSRPLSELNNQILDSMARRLHAEIDLRSVAYRTAYRGAAFKGPQVHFVPMGTFAAAMSASPTEFSQFDHSADARGCKKVLGAAWESKMIAVG